MATGNAKLNRSKPARLGCRPGCVGTYRWSAPRLTPQKMAVLLCMLYTLIVDMAMAAPANSTPGIITQPGGETFYGVRRGDEYRKWVETLEGYSVARAKNGVWHYVLSYDGQKPKISKYPAHISIEETRFGDDVVITEGNVPEDIPDNVQVEGFDDSQLLVGPHEGKVLIIAVEFNDIASAYSESTWASRISSVPGAKTIADYFLAASYGKVNLSPAEESYGTFDNGVIGPVLVDLDHPNTGALGVDKFYPEHDVVYEQAIAAADPYIDFGSFDTDGNHVVESDELAVVLVTAGNEQSKSFGVPSIHAHAKVNAGITPLDVDDISDDGQPVSIHQKYAMIGELSDNLDVQIGGQHASTLGVFVHELGHLIYGLPDLYGAYGIDGYGLMGLGSQGMDATVDTEQGETPVLPTAWSQLKLGWVTATEDFSAQGLASAGNGASALSQQGVVGIASMSKVDEFSGAVTCFPDQYFLMQYRSAHGYDRGLSAVLDLQGANEYSGVVIYHVNELNVNNHTANQLLDVEEAGGIAGIPDHTHLWNSSSQSVFDNSSSPSSSFDWSNDDSGVSVTVGRPMFIWDPVTWAFSNRAVNLTIETNAPCPVP